MKISHGNNFNYDPVSFKEKMIVIIRKNKLDVRKLKNNKKVYRTLSNSDWLSHGIGHHRPG